MSSPPNGSAANVTAAATCSSTVTSATIDRIDPPAPTTGAISASALASFRATADGDVGPVRRQAGRRSEPDADAAPGH
jgi:hypothetical protein